MNYFRHYENLINRAKNRVLIEYTERHHIIPKCMGGTDHPSNLVRLTPEEHYIAHQLLVKMYPSHTGLVNAAMMMTTKRPSNKIYGWLRKKYIEICKSKTGAKNNAYNTVWVNDGNKSFKVKKGSVLEHDWSLGRVKKKNIVQFAAPK